MKFKYVLLKNATQCAHKERYLLFCWTVVCCKKFSSSSSYKAFLKKDIRSTSWLWVLSPMQSWAIISFRKISGSVSPVRQQKNIDFITPIWHQIPFFITCLYNTERRGMNDIVKYKGHKMYLCWSLLCCYTTGTMIPFLIKQHRIDHAMNTCTTLKIKINNINCWGASVVSLVGFWRSCRSI